MQSGNPAASGLGDSKLPVFATPNQVTFYLDDPSQHKQMLTLYNPYDFAIKFRVLCTAPSKYVVANAEGILKARCFIYIFIKHSAPVPPNCDVVDKFRIQMYEHGRRILLGKKDIPATLLKGLPPKTDSASADKEHFEQLMTTSSSSGQQQHSMTPFLSRSAVRGNAGPHIVIIIAAIVSFAGLMLPTDGMDNDSQLPSYMHLSLNQKLICAYTLGLVTMVLLRTQWKVANWIESIIRMMVI